MSDLKSAARTIGNLLNAFARAMRNVVTRGAYIEPDDNENLSPESQRRIALHRTDPHAWSAELAQRIGLPHLPDPNPNVVRQAFIAKR